jgi:hypothetical protein
MERVAGGPFEALAKPLVNGRRVAPMQLGEGRVVASAEESSPVCREIFSKQRRRVRRRVGEGCDTRKARRSGGYAATRRSAEAGGQANDGPRSVSGTRDAGGAGRRLQNHFFC